MLEDSILFLSPFRLPNFLQLPFKEVPACQHSSHLAPSGDVFILFPPFLTGCFCQTPGSVSFGTFAKHASSANLVQSLRRAARGHEAQPPGASGWEGASGLLAQTALSGPVRLVWVFPWPSLSPGE